MMLYESLSPLFATPLTAIEEFMTTAQNPYGIISSDNVGPSVANDIKRNAIIAVIFSLIAIGGYIAWRFKKKWRWAMGGVIALIHDALITIGVFSMFWGILLQPRRRPVVHGSHTDYHRLLHQQHGGYL